MTNDPTISSDEVESQLRKILQSEEFKRSGRITQFLQYVVRQTVRHQPEVIRAYSIAVDVFGKGPEFDPQDPYVRNISGLTRKALAKYYRTWGKSDSVLIDVPSGNFIAAFAYRQMTPETGSQQPISTDQLAGQVAVAESQHGDSVSDQIADSSSGSSITSRSGATLPLLAVIPFRMLGGGGKEELAIGELLANEVIARLSLSSLLNLTSRLTTTRYREVDVSYDRLASELDADYALTGTYHVRDSTLRLNFELAEIGSNVVVWADTISTTIAELLAGEESVFDIIARECGSYIIRNEVKLAGSQPLESLLLHTSLLAGTSYTHFDSETYFNRAHALLKNVWNKQPEHATINALLAQWHILKHNRSGGWGPSEIEESKKQVRVYSERALKSDSSNSLALVSCGLLKMQFDSNPEAGFEYYCAAESFNPNEPLVHAYKSVVSAYRGDDMAAIESARMAIRLSPFDPRMHLFETCAAAAEFAANNLEQAEKHALEADRLNSNHTSNIRALIAIQVDLGKTDLAKQNARRLMKKDPGFTTSSYLNKSPTAASNLGCRVARSLELAGVPCG